VNYVYVEICEWFGTGGTWEGALRMGNQGSGVFVFKGGSAA